MKQPPASEPQPSPQNREEEETRWWELDLRSLALARMALGLFVILTVASTVGDTGTFFSDGGVLPREILLRSPFANLWLSFHMGSGTANVARVLNGALALAGLGLAAGWRTWWMTGLCWVLLNSMQARNPFICDRGDLQLSLLLFWGMFLPLGARWSLDTRAGRPPFGSARGVAATALVLQFGLIYLFAAYLKSGPFWLGRADGLEHSLISPLFATSRSLWLAAAGGKALLHGLDYLVVVGELFVALLLLCPCYVGLTRGLAVAMLVVFHLAVGTLFQLGLFPWLGALAAVALVPKEAWDGLGAGFQSHLDRLWKTSEQLEEVVPAGSLLAHARSLFLLGCVALAILSNLASSPIGRGWQVSGPVLGAADALRLSQHWELFSPIPPYYGWFEVQSRDGPVFRGPPTREQPGLEPFPSHRWRMLMIASLYPEFSTIRAGIVRELAARRGITPERGLSYVFHASLPDDAGRLRDPVDWTLWLRERTSPLAPLPVAPR